MKASDEIRGLTAPRRMPYHNSREYQWGFGEAKEEAHMIAFRQELVAHHAKEALELINTDDPAVFDALGQDTVFKIRYALKVYREQQTK